MDNVFNNMYPPMWNRPTNPQNNSFVWVQGESAAKAYPVAPNNRLLMMDSENPVLYIKTADETGRPRDLQVFDLVERKPEELQTPSKIQNGSDFVTKDEVEAVVASTVDRVLKERRNKSYKKNQKPEGVNANA